MADIYLTVGETGTAISLVARDAKGAAYTIPVGSTLTLRLVRRNDGHAVASSLVSFSGSTITWTVAAGDTLASGLFDAQFRVAAPGSKVFYVPTCSGEHATTGLTVEVCQAV